MIFPLKIKLRMPSVTVVIPTHNRAHLLPRAVNSVLNQSFSDWELWIADDGSTDSTAELLHQLQHQDSRIHWVRSANLGVSHARNMAVAASQGKWLAFLDSDDEWLPEKLQTQWQWHQAHPKIPFIHSNELWWRNGQELKQKTKHKKSGGRVFKECLPLCMISPSTVLIERSFFLSCGGFNESFEVCEDYELWLRLSAVQEVGFIDDPLIIKHGGHEDQLSMKYHSMDHWRLKAMLPFLKSQQQRKSLSAAEFEALKEQFRAKCDILIKGYTKHQRLDKLAEVKTWSALI